MNCECNKCFYRRESDFGTIYISCGYIPKNKYDKRFAVQGHCNKYKEKYSFDCSMCKHYSVQLNDCLFCSCDFNAEQFDLFDIIGK